MYRSNDNPGELEGRGNWRVASSGDGLGNYSCLRTCLIWMLAAGATYYALGRIGLAPYEIGDGYLPDFLERFLANPFYQVIGIAFIGVFGYGTVLWGCAALALSGWRNGRSGAGQSLARFVGVPPMVTSDPKAWREFADYGLSHAASPIRDAAALFPGLGFLGTVIGVSIAIGGLEPMMSGGSAEQLLGGLRVAFDTTFMGLVAALCLGILSMIIAATESQIAALRAAGAPVDQEASGN